MRKRDRITTHLHIERLQHFRRGTGIEVHQANVEDRLPVVANGSQSGLIGRARLLQN